VVATDLDPRFTFDSFVVEPANRLASVAARRVADAPGTSYNPLFIYSSSGLGKSHILNGIAHYAARVHPGYGVVYVAVESFLEELTEAIRAGTEEEFRQRYEELHILLLDDVLIKLGAIALENSESAEAGAMWRRGLEINPDNASLQEKLDQLGAAAGA
jgi:chromosomal replication initiator protein